MASIRMVVKKIKAFTVSRQDDILLFLVVFLAALAVFGALNMRALSTPNIAIYELPMNDIFTPNVADIFIVGNKSSNVFHLEECQGAKAMNQTNRVVFDSVGAALEAGYRAAKNCPGLEYLK